MAFPDPLAHIGRCHAIDADQQEVEDAERDFRYALEDFELYVDGFVLGMCDFYLDIHAAWSWGELSWVGISEVYLDDERRHVMPRDGIWLHIRDLITKWERSDAGHNKLAAAAEEQL